LGLAVLHDVAHLTFDISGKRTVAGARLLAGAQGELVHPGRMLVRRRFRGNGMLVDEQSFKGL
jgi:predicted GNAT family N-acyltransferase